MATGLKQEINYEYLLHLDYDDLIKSSEILVDQASMVQLTNCYQNVFRESIIKFLLKAVINSEIQQLSTQNYDDWKRVSFIQKISKLTETNNLQNQSIVPVMPSIKPKIKKYNRRINPVSPKNKPNLKKSHSDIDMFNTSTDKLLFCGYLRNEMGIKNNRFPDDILSVCQFFISDITNIIHPQQIALFNNVTNKCCFIFDGKKKTAQNIQNDLESGFERVVPGSFQQTLLSQYIKQKLIAPYKILFIDPNVCDTGSYYDSFDRYPNTKSIAVANVHFDEVPRLASDKSLSGVVQYSDSSRLKLLNFGGIENTFGNKHIAKNSIYGLDLLRVSSSSLSGVSIIGAWPSRDTMNSSESIVNNWDKVGQLIHKRGHMSLCEINNSNIAVIGGKVYKDHFGNKSAGLVGVVQTEYMINYVEMYNLETNKSVLCKYLNNERQESGSYYNKHSQQIIVFGGRNIHVQNGMNACNVMELYDFHKNMWFDVPYTPNKSYAKYPCIWTVGSKCIFVAKLGEKNVECEWIDLRVCDRNGKNKSAFHCMDSIPLPSMVANNNLNSISYNMYDSHEYNYSMFSS